MIIANGYIRLGKPSDGGLDANGYPTQGTMTYGCPIPCQYTINSRNKLARDNGESIVEQSYSILIENHHCCVSGGRLKLFGGCKEIGEFSVRNVIPLEAVCQLQIIV